MLEVERWILVEAWLSLGLRVEQCPSWKVSSYSREDWQGNLLYVGNKLWYTKEVDKWGNAQNIPGTVPFLSTDDLRHELAHYLSATPEQREKINFGMDNVPSSEQEDAAIAAEVIITAIATAASRIAVQALGGR